MTKKKVPGAPAKKALRYVLTKDNMTVYLKTGIKVIPRSNTRFAELMLAVADGDEKSVESITNPNLLVKHKSGLWELDGKGTMVISGKRVPKALAARLLEFHADGTNLNPLLKLWKNILANPDAATREDLYGYLEYNGHPITPDGCFIAYRAVHRLADGSLVDNHTKTMSNEVGTVVKMNRKDCDTNRNNTCSTGLHAANMDYVKGSYSGKVVVNVKVNPKDVTAIPTDYSNHKMRCCEFKIISINAELTEMRGLQVVDGEIVEDDSNIAEEIGAVVSKAELTADERCPETWQLQKRSKDGRFVKGFKKK